MPSQRAASVWSVTLPVSDPPLISMPMLSVAVCPCLMLLYLSLCLCVVFVFFFPNPIVSLSLRDVFFVSADMRVRINSCASLSYCAGMEGRVCVGTQACVFTFLRVPDFMLVCRCVCFPFVPVLCVCFALSLCSFEDSICICMCAWYRFPVTDFIKPTLRQALLSFG